LSEETKEILRNIAYKRPKMSKISREKCGLSVSKAVVAYNKDGSMYRKELSLKKLASFFQVSHKTIYRYIKSGKYLRKK
jgi:predicted transcriptional regulator YheO